MGESTVSPLSQWENFYVIIGSSAGALTGLQFVVIALIAEAQAAGSMLEIRAFGTPTIVHFCAALLISAVVSAPWSAVSSAGIALGVCGVAGVLYAIMVIRHARKQTAYAPDAEDWFWYTAAPLTAYGALVVAAVWLERCASSLFVVAATTLVLLFIGIHNAWDTVTYVAMQRWQGPKENDNRTSS